LIMFVQRRQKSSHIARFIWGVSHEKVFASKRSHTLQCMQRYQVCEKNCCFPQVIQLYVNRCGKSEDRNIAFEFPRMLHTNKKLGKFGMEVCKNS
jgi:hypothetical protein